MLTINPAVRSVTKFLSLTVTAFLISSQLSIANPSNSLGGLEQGLSDLIVRLSRSVVTVEAYEQSEMEPGKSLFTTPAERIVASGIVCDSNGGILLAASTAVGFDRFVVVFENQRLEATLLGIDYVNDLAMLRAVRPVGVPVQSSASHVCAGQMVVALGNAYGLRASPTIGFCAGARNDGSLMFSLATTCGSIGGGVFDLSGRLLGILKGAIDVDHRMAVAAPAAKLSGVAAYLASYGDRRAGYLGITTSDVDLIATRQGNPTVTEASSKASPLGGVRGGALVTTMQQNCPASLAGLRTGDVVIGINLVPVATSQELSQFIARTEPGSQLQLTVVRNQSVMQVPVTIGLREPMPRPRKPERQETVAQRDSLNQVIKQLLGEIERLRDRVDRIE